MSIAPVSAIIPCYQCADTIERAVTSVVYQTQRPFELILVDDASSGNTLEVLYSLQNRYGSDWINIISLQKNGGPSVARNKGWDIASQPYIAFLDADDAWHPKKIEIQYGWMKRRPMVALTGHDCIWSKSDKVMIDLPLEWQALHVTPYHLLLSNRFPTRSVMMRRDIPFRFDPTKRHSEDYLLWLQIVLGGYDAWQLQLPLAYLYKAPFGEGGLSADLWKMEKGELDNFLFLRANRQINYLTMLGACSYSLLKYLRRILMRYIK